MSSRSPFCAVAGVCTHLEVIQVDQVIGPASGRPPPRGSNAFDNPLMGSVREGAFQLLGGVLFL